LKALRQGLGVNAADVSTRNGIEVRLGSRGSDLMMEFGCSVNQDLQFIKIFNSFSLCVRVLSEKSFSYKIHE
jgi:hypothetical protein